MSETNNPTSNEPLIRLCHIVKWVDFDGYGFNLHAEKGKPGQYIGKVDEGSPAEAAGLKEGDRIIEVNGVNISNENHKQVVQRIKSVPDEAKLLVVDSEADHYYKSKNIVIKHTIPGIVYIRTPDYKMNGVPNGSDIKDYATQELKTRSSSEDESSSEKISSEDGNGEVRTPLEWTEPVKSSLVNNTDMKEVNNFEMRNDGKVTPNATLNLNMTAKELRAQLALRKKYDPKKESLDFRKKYEIVQKL